MPRAEAGYHWWHQVVDGLVEQQFLNAALGTSANKAPAGLTPAGPVAEGTELQNPVPATAAIADAPPMSSAGWNAVEGAGPSPRIPASPRHLLPNRPTAAVVSSSASPQRISTNGGAAGSGQLPRMLLQPGELSSAAASMPLPKLMSPAGAAALAGGPPPPQELPPPPAMLPGMSHRRSIEMAAQQQLTAPPPLLLVASALDSGVHASATPQSPAAAARYGAAPHSGSLAVASPARLSAAAAVAAAVAAPGSYSQCASPLACTSNGSFAAPETIRVTLLLPTGNGNGNGVSLSGSGGGGGGGGSGPNSAAHLAAVPPTGSAASRAVGSTAGLMATRLSANGGSTGSGGGGGWVSPAATSGAFAMTSRGPTGAPQQQAVPSPLGCSSLSCSSAPLPPPLLVPAGTAPAAQRSSGGGVNNSSSLAPPPQRQLLSPPPPPAGARPRNPRASVDAAAGALELPDVDGDTAAAAANAVADAGAAAARADGFATTPPPPPPSSANSPAAAAVAAAAAARSAEGRVSNSGSAGNSAGNSPRMVLRSDTAPKQIWSQAQQRGPAKPAIKKSNLSNAVVGPVSPGPLPAAAAAAAAATGGSGDAVPVSADGPTSAAADKQQQQRVILSSGGAAAAQQAEEPDRLLDLEPAEEGAAAGEGCGEGQPWFDENMQRARNQARLAALELAEEVMYVSSPQEARGSSGSGRGKSGRRRRGGSRDARGSGSSELVAAEGGSRRCESESGAAGHRTIRGGKSSRVHTSAAGGGGGAGGAATGAAAASDASVGSAGDPGLMRRRTFGEVFDHGDETGRGGGGGGGGSGAGGGSRKSGRRKGAPKKSASALTVAWRAFTSLAAKAIGGGGGGRVGAWGGGGGGGNGDDSDVGEEEPLPVQRSRDSRALHRKRLGLDGTQTAPAAWLRQQQQQQQQQQLLPQAAGGSTSCSPMAKSPVRMNSNDPINAAVVAAAMEFLVARSAASTIGNPVARDRTPQASPLPARTVAAVAAPAAAAAAGVVGA